MNNSQPTKENLFEQFMKNSPIYVFFKDDKARAIQLSSNYEKMLGKPLQELLGKTMDELFPSDLAKSMVADDLRTISKGKPITIHEELNGRFYATTKFPILEKGKPSFLAGYTIDITEQKRSEDTIRYQSSLLDHVSDAIIATDMQYNIQYWNRVAEKQYGWTAAEVIGRPFEKFVINDYLGSSLDTILKKISQDGYWKGEVTQNRRDGVRIPIITTLSILTNDANQPYGFIAINRDITERKLAEVAMLESEARYRTLFEQANDAIWILDLAGDRTGRILLANPAAAEMHGYTIAEMENLRITDLDVPDSVARAQGRFEDIQKGGWISGETLHVRKDGTTFPIAFSAGPIKFDGRPCVLAFSRDITERKRAEEENEKLAYQINQNQKLESLGLLAGGIAHDFNNLMGGIFGYIDMASEETKESKVVSYLSKAMNTIDRARGLTAQLLTFAKGGAPVQQIGDLFPFVQETAQFALSGANVSCHFEVPKDLWACNFDKNQIGQVIDNLIINAQQAMPVGGTIELTARNIALAEKEHPLLVKGNYIKLSIKDSGVGIPKELISRIFDPFFTTKAKGHGLGLATCYSIIHRHGGTIDVDSEPGKGSSFHVYLPASTESASSAHKKTLKTHKGSGTFLIMDDEEVMRDTIGDMLETLGYSVASKENGKDAIDFYASETKANRKITGLIFDLTVPGGMGGKAAIEEIRKMDTEIPAFVASGYADDPVMKKPAEYGFTASICKPFRKSELSEMLNKYMKVKK